ncbi:MAG: hypothetical protein JKP98_14225 [Rhodobacteraceae bacterium]|jgi:PBP1b-binding outer membrane lipoprotein LpoB|nr:hypothetical protein [Paracoccaceae bacterium]MBL4557832.1 hypothetical protein [Paracoccaceae bacterium]HBG98836.1 hypothetical protein [Paracoccaceae bacterium]
MIARAVASAIVLALVLTGCGPAPAPNMPLTPQAERLILRYAPEADLSVLTMKDYAVIRQMVYRKDYFWRKRSDIRAYIRANGG